MTRARQGPGAGRERPWLPWVAPVLLVVLAISQLVLTRTAALSPWKGGGFGMFSTNDHAGFRSVRAYALEAGSERRLEIPGELGRLNRRLRHLPDREGLLSLARELIPEAGDARAIRVEVWTTRFAAADLQPEQRELSSAVLELEP